MKDDIKNVIRYVNFRQEKIDNFSEALAHVLLENVDYRGLSAHELISGTMQGLLKALKRGETRMEPAYDYAGGLEWAESILEQGIADFLMDNKGLETNAEGYVEVAYYEEALEARQFKREQEALLAHLAGQVANCDDNPDKE